MKRQNLPQSHNKYKLLSKHSQELVLFFDQTGSIIDCNQVAKDELGYDDEIYHISITDIFQKAIKKVEDQLVINPKYQDKVNETVAYRKNQTCFAVDLKVVTTVKFLTFLGVCTAVNISEKKRVLRELKLTKSELKSSRKVKNEFVANITHELKTPVNGIMGLTETLLETELSPKQLETVNIIHRCCNNMNTLINDLLDFTKIGNNKLILEKREFDFRNFIENIIAFNINRINEKGLKLIVNVANDIPNEVIGDECRLNQILNNLFSNAIKFTSIGQIALEVVKTAQTGNEVELFFMVMDTGIGISLEEKDKLFLSFSQVDGSITRRFGGTGLGLSICRMLVEAMKGTITVDSEKNKGSTFSFTVRLGISKSKGDTLPKSSSYWQDKNSIELLNNENCSSDHNYLAKLLSEANSSPQVMKTDNTIYFDSHTNPSDNKQNIRDTIERLLICIEMESWEKAEEMALILKKSMPEDNHIIKNKALHLLLSVRKEDHDKCISELMELEKLLDE